MYLVLMVDHPLLKNVLRIEIKNRRSVDSCSSQVELSSNLLFISLIIHMINDF